MASDTFLTICQSIARETDEDAITTIVSPTVDYIKNIIKWVNEGYEIVWNKAWKNELVEIASTLTVSGYETTIVASIHHFTDLWITGYKPIEIIDHREFLRDYQPYNANIIQPSGSINGQPVKACFHAKKLYLSPIPDITYTLNYRAKATFTALSADANVPVIDSNILISYGKYKLLQRDKDYDGANLAYMDFERLKTNFMDSLKEHSTNSKSIRFEDDSYDG